MEIRFTRTGKEENDFSCIRKDGSVTWKKVSAFFIIHDMAHFAAETILPLKNSFLEMVAAGTDISRFDLPKEQRHFQLTKEAIFAEHLVNLLVIDITQGRIDDIPGKIRENNEYNSPEDMLSLLTPAKLDAIRLKHRELMAAWAALLAGETIKLIFEE
jgi:hypothetical protein